MKPGDTILLSRNLQLVFVQLTESGNMISSYWEIEAFFQVTDQWTSPLSKKEFEKVFGDHGMKIVDPP